MYKEDLDLNNPQWLICHKTQLAKQENYTQIKSTNKNTGQKFFYCNFH